LNVFQATELFQEFNRDTGLTNVIAASKDAAKRRSGQLNAGPSGGKSSGIMAALRSAKSGIASLFRKYGNIETAKSVLASKGGKLALGGALIALIGTVIWKKTRNKNKVVSALRAQMGKCKLTANPAGCKAALAKQITKWNVAKG